MSTDNAFLLEDPLYGQEAFQTFLDNHKQTKEVHIPFALYGDINLAYLNTKDFHLHSISFSVGEITTLLNIPETIQVLRCENNFLSELKSLPSSLRELYISNNMLSHLNVANCKELVHLQVSYNELMSLDGLPESLISLKCDHNRLTFLDLENNRKLSTFHCHENPLVLKNIPEKMMDGKYPQTLKIEGDVIPEKQDLNVHTTLHAYFACKKMYEDTLRENLLRKNKLLPKCLGCHKNEGMVFTFANQKYQARCGANPPCDWKIVIQRGNYCMDEIHFETYWKTLEDLKQNIIHLKMTILFRHISEGDSKKQFEELKKAHDSFADFLQAYLKKRELLYFHPIKDETRIKKENEIQCLLEEVRLALEEIRLHDAVEIQYKHIRPVSKSIQELQYEYTTVLKKEGTVTLVQNVEDIHHMETNLGEILSVLSHSK